LFGVYTIDERVENRFYRLPTGLRSGYDAWYFTPKIQFGKSWGKTYFSSSLTYRYKTNGYAVLIMRLVTNG
ncbi:MAG: hypothetical protein BRD49_01300, partial [Bacteroidetes bacterium SW_10_40_5]